MYIFRARNLSTNNSCRTLVFEEDATQPRFSNVGYASRGARYVEVLLLAGYCRS